MRSKRISLATISATAVLFCSAAVASPPAIVSTGNNGFTIGNTTQAFSALGLHDAVGTTVPWGGSVALNQAGSWLDSAINGGFPQKGICEFSGLYQLLNTSNASTTFTVYLSGGPLTAPFQNYGTYTIGAGQAVSFNAYLYLAAGTYPLTLRVDPGSSTLPSSNAYVIGSVNVTMTGACGATTDTPKPPPPPPPPTPKADLVSKKGMSIGGKSAVWGGTMVLNQSDVLLMSNGKCAFNVSYDMSNVGAAAAGPSFMNRILSGTQVVSQQTALSLKNGETRQIYTQMYLSPGTQTVRLMLDAENTVAESNETNNSSQVYVNVNSTCAVTVRK